MNDIRAINFAEAFNSVTEYWSPRVVSQVNGQYVKLAKLKGQLVWHKHDQEDELFQIVRGKLRIEFEGGKQVELSAGEFCVVPKGVLHNPVADEECWVVLVETATTKHTGDLKIAQTKSVEEQLNDGTELVKMLR